MRATEILAEGEAGLHDRRLSLASAKRAPVDMAMPVERWFRQRYGAISAKCFHKHLVRDHYANAADRQRLASGRAATILLMRTHQHAIYKARREGA